MVVAVGLVGKRVEDTEARRFVDLCVDLEAEPVQRARFGVDVDLAGDEEVAGVEHLGRFRHNCPCDGECG